MNYRIAGLIGLLGSPLLFMKLALAEVLVTRSNNFVILANIGFDVSALAILTGLLILSSTISSILSRILFLSGIAVIGFNCMADFYAIGTVNHHLLIYLENIRCSEAFLISSMGSIFLITGKAWMWKKYDWQILLFWMIANFLIFSWQQFNVSYILVIQAISSIVISLSGYRIYTSEDPGIIKENMLYEVSTL
ncbi:MAG TPA: hypothetical protein VFQ58_06665 [Flavisolibacter sp.]|jgi:hypothetical protein|nr:hypothetical protein [Flavisolibacter sp.]